MIHDGIKIYKHCFLKCVMRLLQSNMFIKSKISCISEYPASKNSDREPKWCVMLHIIIQ